MQDTRRGWQGLVILAAWLLAGTCHALEVKDDRGHVVQLAKPPQRVISLLPSLTESVCALGACDRLVAVDKWSNWPRPVQQLPKSGAMEDANVELLVSLRPDVVLVAQSSKLAERLEALGLKVMAFEAKTRADIPRVLNTLAPMFPGSQPAKVWREIEATTAAAQQSVGARLKGQRVYFEVSDAIYAAGASSFIGELMGGFGLQNVVPAELGPFPKINPEFVVRANPQWILHSGARTGKLQQRPGWSRLAAFQPAKGGRDQVCAFPRESYEVLIRPGPRMGEAAQILARCLNGQMTQPASPTHPTGMD